jgi:excisionase family DNA binding protein
MQKQQKVIHPLEAQNAPLLLTRREIALRYGISLRHLDYLIRDGIIPSVRLGKRCLRIPVEAADKVVRDLQTGGLAR